MEYPKPVMKMGELVKMGFPRSFLDEAYRERGQDFAQKGPKSNSPIFSIQKDLKMENKKTSK